MLKVVTAPTVEPLTLEEVRLFLRIDTTDEDQLLSLLISDARQQVENITKRALISTTYLYSRPLPRVQRGVLSGPFRKLADQDEFPFASVHKIELPMGRLQSVTSVERRDGDAGTWATMAADTYRTDTTVEPGVIWPVDGWSDDLNVDHLRITYVVGYGDEDDVPAPLKRAMLMAIGEAYRERELGGFPEAALRACQPYILYSL